MDESEVDTEEEEEVLVQLEEEKKAEDVDLAEEEIYEEGEEQLTQLEEMFPEEQHTVYYQEG